MASNKLVTLIAAVLILLPAIAMAKKIVVGDRSGWTQDFDYQAWAQDKIFQVGDTLVFKYKPPEHDVYTVDKDQFKECYTLAENKALTSGKDKVELKTTGQKWYICGVPFHCDLGMKLTINVTEKSSATRGTIFSGSQVFVAATFAAMAIVV